MFPLKLVVALWAVFSILATLPTAAQCDTSYYEKYYSARRFLPMKKTSMLEVNFTLDLKSERLEEFELVALVGDIPSIGLWRPDKAIILNKTVEYGVWHTSVQIAANSSLNYRYFIAVQDKLNSHLQIRRWESSLNSRFLNISTHSIQNFDNFGEISRNKKEIQRGWLHSGHIIQFKLFRNPLSLMESYDAEMLQQQQLRVKLTPVDPVWLKTILPSARAYTEYVRMVYGNSFLQKQPEHGVLIKENDIIMFQVTVADLNNVAYLFQLYAEDIASDTTRVIGYEYIKPEVLHGTEGEFVVNLLSPMWMNTIGSVRMEYLIINPLPNSLVDFRTTFVDYWRQHWQGLEAGHRGLGKSLKEITNVAPVVENTVASMLAAAALGTDLVEFDVQLTKDLVPIIYHDYSVFVCMESKTPTNKYDLTEVLIKDVTYDQLKDLTTYQVVGSKLVEYASHNSLEDENLRLFPTFEDFLTKVNNSVGFDIEIKWPQLKSSGEWESLQTIDKNLYIDKILEVMLKHGCGRLSFFTSFDADICSLLRFKQNMYPVMFLSSSKESNYIDPRSNSIYDTINNAQAFDLAGIAPNAVFIKTNPNWIEIAKKQSKMIFLWGADLKDREAIDWFIAQGPTGVIYDRMDLYLPANHTSAFEKGDDMPDFFQLQCPPEGPKENATITSILSNVNML